MIICYISLNASTVWQTSYWEAWDRLGIRLKSPRHAITLIAWQRSMFVNCGMSIKLSCSSLFEINKLSLGQHLSCQKFDVMLSLMFHIQYNAHWAAHLTITSLTAILFVWLTGSGFWSFCQSMRSAAFHLLFASLKSKIMTTVFSGISHNDIKYRFHWANLR